MSRDPLLSLLRFRQSAVDEAQKALAEAYRVEQEAIAAVRRATETLELEMREASSLTAGDDAVEAFARWLPVGRKDVADAHARQREATTNLDQLRAVMTLARASVRAVEALMEKKAQIAAQHQKQKEQAELDEFAMRRR
ncbi:flagellar export protein FliJ [Acetobacteraceae bacterium KSS8]|uniref:Flagellar FliJ protein n=1 Tax=Endosaccharibacter trunci TaxID=2812733 RepID=A0ABT1WAL5_9PROT|nr:flagellar export protein FliJ [Acetobacteraceae bacterium KSS8]